MRAIAPSIALSVAALALTACTTAYDIVIESRARSKMDVSAFQRVLVPGFVAGGIDDIENGCRNDSAAAKPVSDAHIAPRDRCRDDVSQ